MKSESQGPVHGGPLRLWQDFGLYSKYNGKRWEGSELGWEGSSEAVRSGHICFDVQTSLFGLVGTHAILIIKYFEFYSCF